MVQKKKSHRIPDVPRCKSRLVLLTCHMTSSPSFSSYLYIKFETIISFDLFLVNKPLFIFIWSFTPDQYPHYLNDSLISSEMTLVHFL